jgi:ASC-1-like (ASCH) protein
MPLRYLRSNMDHIAIMQKSWGFTEKIVAGHKTIESRWYKVKHTSWGRISPGDNIYFKDSGEPVTIQAKITRVVNFSDLTPEKVQTLVDDYSKELGLDEADIPRFFEMCKHKRYCILIYLKDAHSIQPFEINKQGFGSMSSWICVESIANIKV